MFDLDESLGFLLNRAALAMKRALEERLEPYGLTAPQWAVLARLWQKDGQPLSSVGRSLHLDKPTITGVIDRLEKKRLVKRHRDLDDRRVIRVFLSRSGSGLKTKLPNLASEVNAIALKGIKKHDTESLKAMLNRVWKNF